LSGSTLIRVIPFGKSTKQLWMLNITDSLLCHCFLLRQQIVNMPYLIPGKSVSVTRNPGCSQAQGCEHNTNKDGIMPACYFC